MNLYQKIPFLFIFLFVTHISLASDKRFVFSDFIIDNDADTEISGNAVPTAGTISGTTAICVNSSSPAVTFTGTGGTRPYTFVYNVNNRLDSVTTSNTSNTATINAPTNQVGTFIYTLIRVRDTDGTLPIQNQTATITVSNEYPGIPTISPAGTTEICSNGLELRTDNLPGYRYQWNLNGSPILNANSYNHLATASGNYTVTVTNAGNCSATSSVKELILVQPSLAPGNGTDTTTFENRLYFTRCTSSFPASVSISNSTLHQDLVQSYHIDWGDNSSGVDITNFNTNQRHSYLAGFYTLTVTLRTRQGCTSSKSYGVFIGNNPSGTLRNPGNLSGCAPYTITFPIDAPDGNIPGTRYRIDFGDNESVTYIHPNVPDSVTHTYTISSCGSNPPNSSRNAFVASMVITNPCYPPAITTIAPIIINSAPIPEITVNPNPACLNSLVNIRNTSTPGNIITPTGCNNNSGYYWTISPSTGWTTTSNLGSDGGDPNDYTAWENGSSALDVRFNTIGNYTVTLYTSNLCGAPKHAQRTICVQAPLSPQFTIDRNQGCVPLTVNTNNTTTTSNTCTSPTYNWSVTYEANYCGNTSGYTFTSGTNSSSVSPSFQFTNPGVYTIRLRATSEACGTQEFTQTVRVTRPPNVSINSVPDFCGSASINPVANVNSCAPAPGVLSYVWSFPGGTPNSSSNVNPGTISYNSPGSYTISLTVTNECGASTTATRSFVVNQRPSITNASLSQTICSGLRPSPVNWTSDFQNVTYSWSATATPGITGFISSGTTNALPVAQIYNSGSNPGTVTYTVTPSLGNCSGLPVQYIITVNPSPAVTFSLPDQTVCSSVGTQAVTLNSSTTGADFSWTANSPNGITGVTTSGTGTIPVQTLINSTSAPISVTYRATATVPGTAACAGATYDYTITVNPNPVISGSFTEEICSGKTFSVSPRDGGNNHIPTGTRYSWSAPTINPAGSITGASQQNTPQQTISQTLVNTTGSVAMVTYSVTPVTNNCNGTPFNVTVSVDPQVTIDPVNNLTLCHNDQSREIVFTGSLPGTLYRWTSDNTSIGVATSGSNRIPSFTAINTGTAPVTATITVTPSIDNGTILCEALPIRFTITVNPSAQVTNPGAQNVCNARSASITFSTSNTGGITTYHWTNSNTNIGLAAAGDDNISFTPINSGNSVLSANLTVTPTYTNGGISCSGPPENFIVTVNPTPSVLQPADQTVCNSFRTADVQFSGNMPNESFNWTNDNTSIGLPSGGSGNIAAFAAVNNGSVPVVARITVTPSINGCNSTSRTFTITVNPSPIFTRQPESSILCLGETPALLSVQYSNGTGTPTYQWYSNTTNSTVGGTPIPNATTATYMPPSTRANRRYYYCVITFPTGGCNILTSNIAQVTINRRPVISAINGTIGSGETFTIVPDSLNGNVLPVGTTYTWTEPVVVPSGSVTGASAQTSPQSSISQELTNNTTSMATVTYRVTPTSGTCIGEAFPVVITVNPPLNPNATIAPLTCFGSNDGSITTRIQGGEPFTSGDPYRVQWTGPDGFTTTQASITNLRPGNYRLLIIDSMGMQFSNSYTINEPQAIQVITDSEKDITCFGAANGEIQITTSGGTGSYTYTWTRNNILFSNSEDLTNLSPGRYQVSVTDVNNCSPVVLSYTITQPDSLEITLQSQTNIICFGDSTGAVSINVRGGTLIEISPGIFDYRYQWTGPGGFISSEKDLSNIPAGTYYLTVTDSSLCGQRFTVTITQPDDIVITPVTTPISCYGANNATLTLNIEGGVAPYSARWSNYASGTFQNNLSAGDYTITVTDANNCHKQITVTVPEAPIFRVTPVVKNVTCYGANDGSITLNYEGKQEPITLTWSDNSTSGTTRNNIGPGTYSVLIDGGDLCMINRTFVITEPLPMTISSVVRNAVECDKTDGGAIDILVQGGTPPYRYSWSNGLNTEDLENITAGHYAVTVTDSVGCVSIGQFDVTRPSPIDISLETKIDYNCDTKVLTAINHSYITGGIPPYLIKWSRGNVSDENPEVMETVQGGYVTISVTDTLGCRTEATFDIQIPRLGIYHRVLDCNLHSSLFDALVIDQTEKYTYHWDFGDGTSSDLKTPEHTYKDPGEYKVSLTVIDKDLCVSTYQENILIEYPPAVALDREPKFCTGDSLLVYALGADSYRWSNGTKGDSLWIKNPGEYSVTGTSIAGCTNTYNFTASLYDIRTYTIYSDVTEVNNEQNSVHFWTENIPYSDYRWSFGDSLSATGYDVYHTYDISRDGYFDVKLQVINPDGCIEEAQKSISISLISFANTFTPNGDGINDFYLDGWKKEIYNRNGILIFKGTGGWDGTHNGKPVASDTYFVIVFDSTADGAKSRAGYVTVIR